jgi:hypothetical protein
MSIQKVFPQYPFHFVCKIPPYFEGSWQVLYIPPPLMALPLRKKKNIVASLNYVKKRKKRICFSLNWPKLA